MAGIYTSAACIAGEIRDTKDSLNYGFGGATVGVFLGMKAGSIHKCVLNAIILGAAGTACSYSSKLIQNPVFNSKEDFTRRYSYMPQNEEK